jgi:mannan endo-1,4-beta-mannosidase
MKKFYTIVFFAAIFLQLQAQTFVQTKQQQFFLDSKPYYYIGANYWYGSVLGLQKDRQKGFERLRTELEFLKSKGINNLRVLAGAEGEGLVNGVQRVGPPLQTEKGKFNASVLDGLDILLNEMSKRNMKAILFLSNNWEWSGGFLQYLRWNGLIDDSVFRRKLQWDEMRDYVSKFYSCDSCKKDYLRQVEFVLNRTNKISGKKYIDEPAIMAWELANEPRPMRPSANEAYKKWIGEVAGFIKSKDKNHLVTLGHEGYMGTESLELFEQVHTNKNVDYLTIHIWPKNWSWFQPGSMENDFSQVISKTEDYINKHAEVAKK